MATPRHHRNAQMVLTEREVLVALYRATGGDTWRRKDGWDTDADISLWDGVMVRYGHVVKLDLHNNNLQGNAHIIYFVVIDL